MTSLHAAAYSGDLQRVKSLVNRGVDINSQTSDRWTALHRAVHQQKEDVVRFLVDNGANPNIPNCDGQTSLHVAASNDNVLIILLLIEGHAEINPRDVSFLFTEGLFYIHQEVLSFFIEHHSMSLQNQAIYTSSSYSVQQEPKSMRQTKSL